MKKTIANTNDLIKNLNLEVSDEYKKALDVFFKKKVMHITDNKITYPKIQDLKKHQEKITTEISNLEGNLSFWKKNKSKIEMDKKLIPITMYFKKNFWRHKIKEFTNKDYKQDVKDTRLSDRVLLDPEYKNLFETFLKNPDYRKKLKETVSTSIVYKQNGIGVYSEKKKNFKIKNSEMKIKEIEKKIENERIKHKIISKIIEIIKNNS